MNLPQIVLALTSVVNHQPVMSYHFDFVANVTKILDGIYSFHSLVVFYNDSALFNVEGHQLEEELSAVDLDLPVIRFSDAFDDSIRLRPIINANSLGIVVMNQLTDSIRKQAEVALTHVHNIGLVFILTTFDLPPTQDDMERFFAWCWKQNLLNTIITFETGCDTCHQVYSYTPFPDAIYTINLTEQEVKRYFWNKLGNVKGYKFCTPAFIDVPLVMKVVDKTTNTTRITGNAAWLYKEFVRYINATFILMNITSHLLHLHQKDVVRLTSERVIDVSIHPFTYLLPFPTAGSYPIAHTNACLILPVVAEIDRYFYVIYAFSHQMWGIIAGLFMTFLSLGLIANYTYDGHLRVGDTLQWAIGAMINQPPSHGWRAKFGLGALSVFTGFYVANLYTGALTSLFSTTVYGVQPETVEDILRTDLTILLLDYEKVEYFDSGLFPETLLNRIRITDPDTLAAYKSQLNTSFAYLVKEEHWNMISYQQSRLWKPLFKIASEFCVPNMFLSFPIQFDSPFYELLKWFTLRANGAGLHLQWSKMSNYEAHKSGLIPMMREARDQTVPLSLEHFKLVFGFIGICYLGCLGCLTGEHVVYWYARRRTKDTTNRF